jgi:SAM-dependent methyltransferase
VVLRTTSSGNPALVRTGSSVASIPVPAGRLEVGIDHPRVSGVWRFETGAPSLLTVDFLAADPIDVAGGTALERGVCDGFIPTPRIRVRINGVEHEVVSSAESVLERNYSRPDHQTAYVADRWGTAFNDARLRQCRRLLEGISGEVCDVGSGYSMVWHSGPWPFTVHAFDRDPAAVAALQQRGVDSRCAPADDPPFEGGRFDAVYAGEIIEHLTEPNAALRRWVELLKPNGRLIVTTPNRRHLLARVRGFELVENPEHLFEWDLRQLRRAVIGAGAEVDAVEGLIQQIPVFIPGRGWRDLTPTMLRYMPHTPRWFVRAMIDAGRWAPSFAYNLAVAAHRTR